MAKSIRLGENPIKCFPSPLIISEVPSECGCSWVYAPDISRSKRHPFVIKYPKRGCAEHWSEYARAYGL